MKIALFIENRRQSGGLNLTDIAAAMGITPNTYRSKLKKDGFTEAQLLIAAKELQFDIILIPKEADIFTA